MEKVQAPKGNSYEKRKPSSAGRYTKRTVCSSQEKKMRKKKHSNNSGKIVSWKESILSPGIAGLAILFVIVNTGLAAAYLAARASAVNAGSFGFNESQIEEEFDPPEKLEPDMVYRKAVRVLNTGNTESYVRVKAAFSDDRIRECSFVNAVGTAGTAGTAGSAGSAGSAGTAGTAGSAGSVGTEEEAGPEWLSIETFERMLAAAANPETAEPAESEKAGQNALPEGWVFLPEGVNPGGGYFYYTKVLEPGQYTPYLWTRIRTVYPDPADLTPYDILVYEESVQTLDRNGHPFQGANAWRQAWEEFLTRKLIDEG